MRPCPNLAALVALVEVTPPAEEAVPARRAVTAQNAIALGHLGHGFTGGSDRAHELVPQREARFDLHATVVDVQVGAADARGLHPHDRVVAGKNCSAPAAPPRGPRPAPGRSPPASRSEAIRMAVGSAAMANAFYTAEDGLLVPSELTRGPWDPGAQHAGPPAALLGRAIERCEPRAGLQLGRVTFEILRPVPLEPLEASARVVRPGRSVELLEASLSGPEGEVMRALAWRLEGGRHRFAPQPRTAGRRGRRRAANRTSSPPDRRSATTPPRSTASSVARSASPVRRPCGCARGSRWWRGRSRPRCSACWWSPTRKRCKRHPRPPPLPLHKHGPERAPDPSGGR